MAGLIWSVAIGLVIVLAFDGAGGTFGRSDFTAIFDVIAGVAAIAFAAGVRRGGITARPRDASRERTESRLATRLRNPSPLTAAAGGVVTHIPGLIYLVALNAIAADQPRNASALGLVSLYNVLWFAIPIAALTLSIVAPGTATAYLDRATAWARRHREMLLDRHLRRPRDLPRDQGRSAARPSRNRPSRSGWRSSPGRAPAVRGYP